MVAVEGIEPRPAAYEPLVHILLAEANVEILEYLVARCPPRVPLAAWRGTRWASTKSNEWSLVTLRSVLKDTARFTSALARGSFHRPSADQQGAFRPICTIIFGLGLVAVLPHNDGILPQTRRACRHHIGPLRKTQPQWLYQKPSSAGEAAMRHQPMIADRATKTGDDRQEPECHPVQPGVVVEIGEGGEPERCGQCDKTKEHDRSI